MMMADPELSVAGPSTQGQSTPSPPIMLPTSCPGCYLPFGSFMASYGYDVEGLINLLQHHGVLLKERVCERCGDPCTLDIPRKAFRCQKLKAEGKKRKRACNTYVSLFQGTWFHRSRMDFETVTRFVNLFVQDYFSYKTAQDEFEITDKTICDWASFCREVLVAWCLDREDPIGGEGEIVEIDESKFGRRKYNVGRVIEGQWVFGAICRGTRSFFMVPVRDRSAATLLSIIKARVKPGTTIISDCWKAYDCLDSEGYRHLKVNHSLNFVDPLTKAHTNTIERKWRDAKRRVPGFGRRTSHFVGYLATAMFKMALPCIDHRFHVFMTAAAKLYPPSSS